MNTKGEAMNIKIRKLLESEVRFTVTYEPETEQVEGNYMCTDDAESDHRDEQEILARLRRGDVLAWCQVIVCAEWNGVEGRASLGCCSFDESARDKDLAELADAHGMRDEALQALQRDLEDRLMKLASLAEVEGVI